MKQERVTVHVHRDKLFDLMKELNSSPGPHWQDSWRIMFDVSVLGCTANLVIISLPKASVDAMMERQSIEQWKEKFSE